MTIFDCFCLDFHFWSISLIELQALRPFSFRALFPFLYIFCSVMLFCHHTLLVAKIPINPHFVFQLSSTLLGFPSFDIQSKRLLRYPHIIGFSDDCWAAWLIALCILFALCFISISLLFVYISLDPLGSFCSASQYCFVIDLSCNISMSSPSMPLPSPHFSLSWNFHTTKFWSGLMHGPW